MINFGNIPAGTTLYIPFCSYGKTNGESITLTGLATTDIEIYKNGSTTQRASDNGYALLDTDGIDFDGITGLHGFSVDLSDNSDSGFYSVGGQYWVVVSTVTIDSQTVTFIAATFRIVAAENTAGYPVVDAGKINNVATSSVTTINANLGTTQPINFSGTGSSAYVKGDVQQILSVTAPTNSGGRLLVDGGMIRQGTAQAGASTSITLDAGASSTNDYYLYAIVHLSGGTGAGQHAQITAYNGTTKVATVDRTWATNPDNTTTFNLFPEPRAGGGTPPTAAAIADQVWEEALTDHSGTSGSTAEALNAAGSAGDPWNTSLPGAYASGKAGYILGTNLDATVSSRASQTSVDTIDDFVDTEISAIKTKTDFLPSATAGSAGGLFIAGTNAATTITSSSGSALTLSSTGSNGSGLDASGNGSGSGIKGTGGATGHGLLGVGGATSGAGFRAEGTAGNSPAMELVGQGSAAGFKSTGGATGNGVLIVGGGTSGDGVLINTTSGHGVNSAPTGSSKHGILSTGGNGGTSDGIKAVAGTGGVDYRGTLERVTLVDTVTTLTNASGVAILSTLINDNLTLYAAKDYNSNTELPSWTNVSGDGWPSSLGGGGYSSIEFHYSIGTPSSQTKGKTGTGAVVTATAPNQQVTVSFTREQIKTMLDLYVAAISGTPLANSLAIAEQDGGELGSSLAGQLSLWSSYSVIAFNGSCDAAVLAKGALWLINTPFNTGTSSCPYP